LISAGLLWAQIRLSFSPARSGASTQPGSRVPRWPASPIPIRTRALWAENQISRLRLPIHISGDGRCPPALRDRRRLAVAVEPRTTRYERKIAGGERCASNDIVRQSVQRRRRVTRIGLCLRQFQLLRRGSGTMLPPTVFTHGPLPRMPSRTQWRRIRVGVWGGRDQQTPTLA